MAVLIGIDLIINQLQATSRSTIDSFCKSGIHDGSCSVGLTACTSSDAHDSVSSVGVDVAGLRFAVILAWLCLPSSQPCARCSVFYCKLPAVYPGCTDRKVSAGLVAGWIPHGPCIVFIGPV